MPLPREGGLETPSTHTSIAKKKQSKAILIAAARRFM
jgi:hypothetical protein